MSSKPYSDERLLELDLPTTEEDVEALRRVRRGGSVNLAAALEILSRLELPSPKASPPRLAVGWIPFSLE